MVYTHYKPYNIETSVQNNNSRGKKYHFSAGSSAAHPVCKGNMQLFNEANVISVAGGSDPRAFFDMLVLAFVIDKYIGMY